MEAKELYNLKLHQEELIDSALFVRRVVGGWIYTQWHQTEEIVLATTFVPYSEEFKV